MKTGKVYTFNSFAFTNKFGGTGLSNWKHDEIYEKPTKFFIMKSWDDYETGIRAWGTPVDDDTEILEYLKRNANLGVNVSLDDDNPDIEYPENYIIFLSEHDLVR